MPPLRKGAYCFATVGRSVGRYVGLSVCRPSLVRSISFDPFTWSIPNFGQGLPSMSRWSLLIFRSHVQRSRSNHSSQPSVLSAQYLLTPFTWSIPNLVQGLPSMSIWSLLIFRSHVQRSRSNHSSQPSVFFWPLSLGQYQTWCRGCPQWAYDLYWFSGHMFKGQGQTTLLSPLCCPLNVFWPLYLINIKLGAGVALNK